MPVLRDVQRRHENGEGAINASCASGQHIKTAVLTCRKPGKAPFEFLKITLTDVTVSSYEIDGSDDELPLDQIALSFAKVEMAYTPQGPTGKSAPPVKAALDLKKNAKV